MTRWVSLGQRVCEGSSRTLWFRGDVRGELPAVGALWVFTPTGLPLITERGEVLGLVGVGYSEMADATEVRLGVVGVAA